MHRNSENVFVWCLFHRVFRRNSTVKLFNPFNFEAPKIPNKRRKSWSKKRSSKKHYKRVLPQEESNINNTFPDGLVKRVLNDKANINNYMMAYDYYTKLLKYHGSALLS